MLRNLNELANASKGHYNKSFVNEDFKLNREFKERFEILLEAKGNEIQYLEYSAEITTSSNNKIFCPNQWFYIATFVVEFAAELIKYRQILNNLSESQVDGMTRNKFFEKIKSYKGKETDDISIEIKEAVLNYFDDDIQSAEFLFRFITDYAWWYGSKTIDRHDYYVSPTLHLLGLVNVSQGYVAEIVYYLASDSELMRSALHLQELELRRTNNKPSENLIVYGAPGTGKSRYLEDNFTNITRVVFHTEYSYFDFVGSYKPTPLYKSTETTINRLNGERFEIGEPIIDYQYIPGPFINVLVKAIQNPDINHTLLIEEINRANAPAVFGDIFQLLDRRSDGFSQYKIRPNTDLNNYLMSIDETRQHFKNGLYIPNNMSIVATMNSADQGVFVLDSAFKRRWKFKYLPIKEKGFVHENVKVNYAGESFEWRLLLSAINRKLKDLGISEDRLIGPYFINTEEINDNSSFASKLLIYLWDDVVRYKRPEFFDKEIRTYSELVTSFVNGNDVMNIKTLIFDIIEKEQELEEREEQNEDGIDDENAD
ncbi:AAA family ATPase [Lederbergia graminis]|uniref:AAA family ATPase n=1 Tax=Lederbergia graminis TaxID=735518 RepID=A0ABW0LL20_9BACI